LFRTGIPGALMILALYVGAGLHARASARERQDDERLFSTLIAGSVVIAAAHAVILSLYVEPIYTLTISLILGAALAGAQNLQRSLRPWGSSPAST
jgi:O-antigen ligase